MTRYTILLDPDDFNDDEMTAGASYMEESLASERPGSLWSVGVACDGEEPGAYERQPDGTVRPAAGMVGLIERAWDHALHCLVSVRETPARGDLIIAYTTRGGVRGGCGHVHSTEETAEACLDRDRAGCRSQGGYSDRHVAPITLPDALSLPRVPWSLIRERGWDLEDIAHEATARGDDALRRRAVKAARR